MHQRKEQREPQNKGARALLVVASLVIVIAGLKTASSLILPFLMSFFLALISLPLLNWLTSRRIPRALAVLITLIAALSVLALFAVVVGGSIRGFTDQVPKYKERLDVVMANMLIWFEVRGITLSREFTTDLINPAAALDVATGTLRGLAGLLSNLLMVLLTIAFILFEAAGFPDKLHAAFGQQTSSERYEKIRTEIQRYLGIKSLVSLCTGSIVAAALAIIGIDYPLLWGLLAFLLNYIPTLGSIIAAIPPVLLAIVQTGAGSAIAVAVVFLAVNFILGSVVEPHFMGRQLGLSTLVVFLSLVFWGWVWGPLGMLLSVPLTMILKIMMENTEDLRWIAVLLSANVKARSPAPAP